MEISKTPAPREILEQAIAHYGRSTQMLMAIEEMAELTKALCKHFRATDNDTYSLTVKNIREEMADVRIMLEQLEIMFGTVYDEEAEKLYRLAKRLEASREKGGTPE